MKKFFEVTVQFKFVWSLFFAAAILIYTTISMFLGNSSMELIVIWEFVGLTLILTFFHYLFFGELILKTLGIRLKVFIHSLLCYVTLLASSITFNWISVSKLNHLLIFTGAYIFLYISCVLSFYIYYKATGEELNDRLTAYKEKKSC